MPQEATPRRKPTGVKAVVAALAWTPALIGVFLLACYAGIRGAGSKPPWSSGPANVGLTLWLVMAVPMMAWLARRQLQHLRESRRLIQWRCPRCGYDLRVSPGRCPECAWDVHTDAGLYLGSAFRCHLSLALLALYLALNVLCLCRGELVDGVRAVGSDIVRRTCWALSDQRFDPVKWRRSPVSRLGYSERYDMARDLVDRKVLLGLTEQEVETLLGKAVWLSTYSWEGAWVYDLGRVREFLSRDRAYLLLRFDKTGRVCEAEWTHWGY